MILFLRSTLYALGSWFSTIIMGPASLLTFPFPFSVRYGLISQWARFNLWWLRVTCGLTFQVEGKEHIPKGNAIIMCKHQSAWETLALQLVFPQQIWVLKRELLRVPLFGWGLAMLEPIAIDRSAGKAAVKQLVEQGRERLANGRWVVIFPEGTRVAPGHKGRYGIGGAMLAAKSGYPVVPVAHNAGEFWPRRGFLKHPGVVRMVIGPVIPTEGRSAGDINDEVEHWIESTVAGISSRSGIPDDRGGTLSAS